MLKRLLIRYEWLVICGAIISVWALLNSFGITNTPSDIFWALFGAGAAVEGFIELFYESREDEKYSFDAGMGNDERRAEILSQKMNDDPMGGVVTVSHGNVGLTMSFHTFRRMLLAHEEGDENDERRE